MNLENLKYPIGKFQRPEEITSQILQDCIADITSFPTRLHKEVDFLDDSQLETPYRPGGWSVRQVVNHCADSHMNGLIRVKLALTEDKPVIKPYLEGSWAQLEDSEKFLINPAFRILEGVHERWGALLNSLGKDEWQRTFIHPDHGREITIKENTCHYAWHCNHHLAHITSLKKRNDW